MSVMTREAGISETDMIAEAEKALADISKIRDGVGRVIYGQEIVVDRSLITILAGGHGLLVGVPGLAKTKLVETLGIVLGLDARRIQFTPDLMPSDILGSEVMEQDEQGKRAFRFLPGPIFAQLLMADEINRASPRTQSALLQSMQEYHVTITGQPYALPQPFHVLATQNPLEQEGTYPLPEAQLDRFLMEIDVEYPDLDAEKRILLETTGTRETPIQGVIDARRLQEIQTLIRRMPVSESVLETILSLVRSARPGNGNEFADQKVAWGPGPRAGQALMLTARARALYQGRFAPSIDDVVALAGPILQHRMALTFAARADGVTMKDVISKLVAPLRAG